MDLENLCLINNRRCVHLKHVHNIRRVPYGGRNQITKRNWKRRVIIDEIDILPPYSQNGTDPSF